VFTQSPRKATNKSKECPFERIMRQIAGPHLDSIKSRQRLARGEEILVWVKHPEKGEGKYRAKLIQGEVVLSKMGEEIQGSEFERVIAKKPFVPLDRVDCVVFQMMESGLSLETLAEVEEEASIFEAFFSRFPMTVWSRDRSGA